MISAEPLSRFCNHICPERPTFGEAEAKASFGSCFQKSSITLYFQWF